MLDLPPKLSAFFELSRRGREAKENKFYFLCTGGHNFVVSPPVAEGPDGAFGASRRS